MKGQNLFSVRQESGKTIVEITDLPLLRRAFGDDLIVAFCRSFVWTDRLMSMNFLGIQVAGLDSTSVRFGRDMHTMLWFICGCLRELARALEALLSTGIEGFLEPAKVTLLEEVRKTLVRWNTDSFFTLVRDKVGFHIDSDVLTRGLDKLAASTNTVIFMENDGPGMGFTRVSFAHELLITGLFASGDEEQEELSQVKNRMAQFVIAVQNDHARVATLLEHILIACIEGTEAGRTRLPAAATPKPSTQKALLEQTRQVLRTVGKHLEGWDETKPLPEKAARVVETLRTCRAELKACRAALKRPKFWEGASGDEM